MDHLTKSPAAMLREVNTCTSCKVILACIPPKTHTAQLIEWLRFAYHNHTKFHHATLQICESKYWQ